MMAVLFGEDEMAIAQYKVTTPSDMEGPVLNDQVMMLANADGLLSGREGQRIYIAYRTYDSERDDAQIDRKPTIH